MARPQRTALVTGANGYIGNAVCRAFVRAGWTVYGLARKSEALRSLAAEEIIPLHGLIGDLSFLPSLFEQQQAFDAIVSTTEEFGNFASHFNDIATFLLEVSKKSNAAGVRPLVLFTSGCKDYGMTDRANSPNLAPHTEDSPLNPPAVLTGRTVNAPRIFDHTDSFDAVILRPTTVYGRSGSYYGPFFELAHQAKENNQPLTLPADRASIVHGTHVDDCAEAYLKLAEQDQSKIAGQVYNISSWRYETLEEVADALVREYGLSSGVVYEPPKTELGEVFDVVQILTGFSQWVGSEKIRCDTGWIDKKPLFSEGTKAYRVAYEEAAKAGHSNVLRIKGYVNASNK